MRTCSWFRWCAAMLVALTAVAVTARPGLAGQPPVMSAAPATYVALGDSYASGEGVEPFLSGTDDAGNRCHRSLLAYPRLLAMLPGMPTRAEFWACSGARIGNFQPGQGQWSEAGQIERLTDETRLVTLSAGGNDLQFAKVLGACLATRGCDRPLGVLAGMLLRHTAPRLAALYRQVLARAPQAQVYVVGYPRFVSPSPSALCLLAGLDPGEARWIDREVDRADAAMRQQVDRIGDPRLHYVSTLDVFTGGEACSASGRFVHGLVPGHVVYSFHPTAAGQALLAERVRAAIGGVSDARG